MPIFEFKYGDDVKNEPAYLGSVLQVDTRRMMINAEDEHLQRASIGKLVTLKKGTADDWLIGMVDRIVRQIVTADTTEKDGEQKDTTKNDAFPISGNAVTVTLVGMVRWNAGEAGHEFTRSLLDMPDIGQDCFVLRGDSLKAFMGLLVKKGDTEQALEIGKYTLDLEATAYLDGDKFFQRHAALLGSTGSGKSWTVATILERAARLPSANLIVFDLHGEYRELSYADHLRIPGPDDLGMVALRGFSSGLLIRIRLGRRTASPTTRASPISRMGNISIKLVMLSGIMFLTAEISLLLVSRNAMTLLHWLRIVSLTSDGRWLTISSDTPYLRPSLAIFSKLSTARC